MQTIITLLKKPENRCAAVTMLGKTVEMCYLAGAQHRSFAPLCPLLLQETTHTGGHNLHGISSLLGICVTSATP